MGMEVERNGEERLRRKVGAMSGVEGLRWDSGVKVLGRRDKLRVGIGEWTHWLVKRRNVNRDKVKREERYFNFMEGNIVHLK